LPRAYATFWCRSRVFLRLCALQLRLRGSQNTAGFTRLATLFFSIFFLGCYFGSVLSSSLSEERLCAILLCLDVGIGCFCSILERTLELEDFLEEFLSAISQFGYCSFFVIWAAVAIYLFLPCLGALEHAGLLSSES
jgi:hypothetical protein